jgi:hypothetical protein
MKFKDLKIGQEFDFIHSAHNTSFYERCIKTGKTTYTSESGMKLRVGTVNCEIGHAFDVKALAKKQLEP